MRVQVRHQLPERLLVIMPTWLGDCVMATPTLRALRGLYPGAHIEALIKDSVRPVIDALPWVDQIVTLRPPRMKKGTGRPKGPFNLARRLARGRFDAVVILPNSFRWALVAMMAAIPRRIGYDRDGRGFLLTERLLPRRTQEGFVPVPTREYFLGLARYLGAPDPDPTMELFIRPEHDAAANALLARAGINLDTGIGLVLLVPGASFGEAKMWHPHRFAAVADRCITELGATVAISGTDQERLIIDRVLEAAQQPLIDLSRLGMKLELLKSMVWRSSLVITNDTGPRHIAAAMGRPVVTIFGPTDPRWTEIGFDRERQVMVEVPCGPCQKKRCPLTGTPDFHQCMGQIHPERVFEHVVQLMAPGRASVAAKLS